MSIMLERDIQSTYCVKEVAVVIKVALLLNTANALASVCLKALKNTLTNGNRQGTHIDMLRHFVAGLSILGAGEINFFLPPLTAS
jgi:hypothetical protein